MPVTTPVVTQTELAGVSLLRRGKVRDIYDLDDRLLIVATDRISAFDCVLPNGIPWKGRVLTQISRFWFGRLESTVRNHLISTEVEAFPEELQQHRQQLEGRAMLCRRAERIDVECVVRGYLIGSGWRDYRDTGAVCGIELPEGLEMASRLPAPIFTPASKSDDGHDENIAFDEMASRIGRETAQRLRDLSLRIYSEAAEYAESRGIIIADTKFEFGRIDGDLALIDEVLTPDSSRFWPANRYERGISPPSFDKQYVRDHLAGLDWDRNPPAPSLPDEVVERTSEKYLEAYRRLTGEPLPGSEA